MTTLELIVAKSSQTVSMDLFKCFETIADEMIDKEMKSTRYPITEQMAITEKKEDNVNISKFQTKT